MTSFLQLPRYSLDGGLPALVLFTAEAFKGIEHGFGSAFGLQVFHENVDVVIEPLQVLALNVADTLHQVRGVEFGLGFGRLAGCGPIGEIEGRREDTVDLEVGTRDCEVDLITVRTHLADDVFVLAILQDSLSYVGDAFVGHGKGYHWGEHLLVR
ncbi:MAG: hypothetical protein JWQ42_3418 [Edaphobacter sp.]|nr:hypothetical protein [Edaphobacter sp.]